MYIHTPLITTSDAEGAGELFQVTTLLNKLSGSQEAPPTEEELAAAEAAVAAKGDQVRALKEKKEKSKVKVAVSELTALKEKLEELKKRSRVVGGLLRKEDGGVDYVDDFFGRQAFLTVSGQLQVSQFHCPRVFPMH
jgi:asparaginyl-tRNA synthetase